MGIVAGSVHLPKTRLSYAKMPVELVQVEVAICTRDYNITACSLGAHSLPVAIRDDIVAKTATWALYNSISAAIPAAITLPVLGLVL